MKKLLQFRSIRSKMLFGFSLVLGLVIILGIYNYFAVNKVNNDTEHLATEQVPLLTANEKLAFNAAQRLATIRGYLLYDEDEFLESFNEYTDDSQRYQERILELTDDEVAVDLVDKSIEWRTFIEEEVIPEHEMGNHEIALQNLRDATELAREIMNG